MYTTFLGAYLLMGFQADSGCEYIVHKYIEQQFNEDEVSSPLDLLILYLDI